MRRCLAFLMAWVAGISLMCAANAAGATADDSAPAAQLHFIGSEALLADKTNAATLNGIAALPETTALEDDILKKLATTPYRFFLKYRRLPPGVTDEATRFRALLEDLLHEESYVELWTRTNSPVPEVVLAVRVGKQRAARWNEDLAEVLTNWSGCPTAEIRIQGCAGWELKKHLPPNVMRLVQAGDWVVAGLGENDIVALPGMVKRIKSRGRPVPAAKDFWLDGWVDWPRLSAGHTNSETAGLPEMRLTLALKGDDVRTKGVLVFPEPLNLPLSPWVIPTNLVHNPMNSFMAVRGIGQWVGEWKLFKDLELQPAPDQWYAWGMAGIPFDAYLAAPVSNAAAFIAQYGPRLIALASNDGENHRMGELGWDETHTKLRYTGLPPVVAPTLSGVSGTDGDFLFLRLFPGMSRRQPAPTNLFEAVAGLTNGLYYEWDLTGPSLIQSANLMAMYYILEQTPFNLDETPARKWAVPAANHLGNCVTAVTLSGPNEITIERKSPLGLCGCELALLLHWVDADGFPLGAISQAPFRRRHPNIGGSARATGPGILPPADTPSGQSGR
jgi:hypothetical protein